MQKKILTAALLLSVAAFTAPMAQAQEQWGVSLCEYTKADDKNRIRKLLRQSFNVKNPLC